MSGCYVFAGWTLALQRLCVEWSDLVRFGRPYEGGREWNQSRLRWGSIPFSNGVGCLGFQCSDVFVGVWDRFV